MVLVDLGRRVEAGLQRFFQPGFMDDVERAVDGLLKEIYSGLLEAGLNTKLAGQLRTKIRAQALARLNDVAPERSPVEAVEIVYKVVLDELAAVLEGGRGAYKPKTGVVTVVLLTGLQGSGKTATSLKLAAYYQQQGYKTSLVYAHTARAARSDKIKQNAEKANVPIYFGDAEADSVKIASAGVAQFRKARSEVIIVDAVGRSAQETAMLEEATRVGKAVKSTATMLVVDGTSGSPVRGHVKTFKRTWEHGAVIVTKLDAQAKGVGTVFAVADSRTPILFTGTGEQLDDLDLFSPRPFLESALGMREVSGVNFGVTVGSSNPRKVSSEESPRGPPSAGEQIDENRNTINTTILGSDDGHEKASRRFKGLLGPARSSRGVCFSPALHTFHPYDPAQRVGSSSPALGAAPSAVKRAKSILKNIAEPSIVGRDWEEGTRFNARAGRPDDNHASGNGGRRVSGASGMPGQAKSGPSTEAGTISDLADPLKVLVTSLSSLVAPDIQDIEEAYVTLAVNVKNQFLLAPTPSSGISATSAIILKTHASDLARCIQRDVHRILAARSQPASSPTPTPMPTRSPRPTESRDPLGQELSKRGATSAPAAPPPGTTAEEVKKRKSEIAAGMAALRVLGIIWFLEAPGEGRQGIRLFSDDHSLSLISTILDAHANPSLPLHPSSIKRLHALTLWALSSSRLPHALYTPSADRIAAAVSRAFSSQHGSVRAEAAALIGVLLRRDAEDGTGVWVERWTGFLRPVVRATYDPAIGVRGKAVGALGALVKAGLQWADGDLERGRTIDRMGETVVSMLRRRRAGAAGKEIDNLDAAWKGVLDTSSPYIISSWAVLIAIIGRSISSMEDIGVLLKAMEACLRHNHPAARALISLAWSHLTFAFLCVRVPGAHAPDAPYVLRPKRLKLMAQIVGCMMAQIDEPRLDESTGRWSQRTAPQASLLASLARAIISLIYAFSGAALAACAEGGAAHVRTTASSPAVLDAVPPNVPDSDVDALGRTRSAAAVLVPASPSPSSSDPPPPPHLTTLDTVFDSVVMPHLPYLLRINSADSVKADGWTALASILSPTAENAWRLDRILCPDYLNGKFANPPFAAPWSTPDSVRSLHEAVEASAATAVGAAELPPWGTEWVLRRFGDCLKLVREALEGLRGLTSTEGEWEKDVGGGLLLPSPVSNAFRSLLVHLSSRPSSTHLSSLTSFFLSYLHADASTFLAPEQARKLGPAQIETAHLGILAHLVDVAQDVLGPATLATVKIDVDGKTENSVVAAFLDATLRYASSLPVELFACNTGGAGGADGARSGSVSTTLSRLAARLLRLSMVGNEGVALLADVSKWLSRALPQSELEGLHAQIWNAAASEWIERLSLGLPQPAATSESSRRLELLQELLSVPLRRPSTPPDKDTLALWELLLNRSVTLAADKRLNPTSEVLEPVAKAMLLNESLEQHSTNGKTIAYYLALLLPHVEISTVSTVANDEHLQEQLPRELLAKVGQTLDGLYAMRLPAPAVELLGAVATLLQRQVPSSLQLAALHELEVGVARWLRDEEALLSREQFDVVVSFFEQTLERLTHSFAPDTATLERLSDFIVAGCARVDPDLGADGLRSVRAFTKFWQATYARAENVEYPEAVARLLREILHHDSSLVNAPALVMDTQDSLYNPHHEPSTPDDASSRVSCASGKKARKNKRKQSAAAATVETGTATTSLHAAPEESMQVDAAEQGKGKTKKRRKSGGVGSRQKRRTTKSNGAGADMPREENDDDIDDRLVVESQLSQTTPEHELACDDQTRAGSVRSTPQHDSSERAPEAHLSNSVLGLVGRAAVGFGALLSPRRSRSAAHESSMSPALKLDAPTFSGRECMRTSSSPSLGAPLASGSQRISSPVDLPDLAPSQAATASKRVKRSLRGAELPYSDDLAGEEPSSPADEALKRRSQCPTPGQRPPTSAATRLPAKTDSSSLLLDAIRSFEDKKRSGSLTPRQLLRLQRQLQWLQAEVSEELEGLLSGE